MSRSASTPKWLAVLAGAGIVALIVAALFTGAAGAGARPVCPEAPSSAFDTGQRAETLLGPVDERAAKPPLVTFRRSRAVKTLPAYRFRTQFGPFPELRRLAWDISLVSTTNDEFPDRQTSVTFSRSLNYLRVNLCLDAHGVSPGSYSGALMVAGAGIEPVTLPLTVTLQDNGVPTILIGLLVAAMAAAFYKWFLDDFADRGNLSPSIGGFIIWIRRQWVRVAIALVVGPGAVFLQDYLRKESFTPSERLGLWVSGFTAFVTASVLSGARAGSGQKDTVSKSSRPPSTKSPTAP